MAMNMQLGTNMAVHLQCLLGQEIVRGAYDEIGFPNEADLVIQYGVSRTVVRESIKMLVGKGIISSRQRRTRIAPISAWNLLDPEVAQWLIERPFSVETYREFTQLRLGIEPVAASLAAQCKDAKLLANLDRFLNAVRTAPQGGPAALQAIIGFHTTILEASGNALFWRLKELVQTALQMAVPVGGFDIDALSDIAQAISLRDSARAEAAMRQLLSQSQNIIEQATASPPERAEGGETKASV